MKYETLIVERKGNLTKVTFNRPQISNAVNTQIMLDIKDLCAQLRIDQETRFVIFTGAGSAFSSGADLKATDERSHTPEMANPRLMQLLGLDFMSAMENLEQVTIAAVNGAAIGAGLSLCMNCDFRIASEKAFFGLPETGLGTFYALGSTPRLVALVGPAKAKELIMTCDNIDAQEAWRIGLVNKVVPAEELMAACEELVQKLAGKGPMALRMTKKIVNAASVARMADLYLFESELLERVVVSNEFTEGIQAAIEKRPPKWS
jgi:enoyl-CoA hydratase/carnithine racemase